MRYITIYIAVILFLGMSFHTIAQMNSSSWRAIENNPDLIKTIAVDYENYISTKYVDSIPKADLSEYKAYLRYMHFWQHRLGDDNNKMSYKPYYTAVRDYLENPICNSSDDADWELMGPKITPHQQQGLITEVLYDPLNPNVPLISSNHGGMWKFNTSTNKWYNVTDTDNLRVPGISATEIVRHPFYHHTLFASTGTGIYNTKYGMGILKSIDNGETWNIMEGFPHANAPRVVKIVIDPLDKNPNDSINMYAISEDSIYYTNNSGESWNLLLSQPILNDYTKLYELEIDSEGSLLISTKGSYGYTGQCFKFDSGTWTEILSNNDSINLQRAKFTTPNRGLIFALIDMVKDTIIEQNGETTYIDARRIYKSTDNGDNWNLYKDEVNGPSGKCEIEYSPASQHIYVGYLYIDVIDYSTGIMETIISSFDDNFHMDIRDIVIIGINNGYEELLVANDGGLSKVRVKVHSLSFRSNENLNGDFLPCNNLIGLDVEDNNFVVTGAVHGNSFKGYNHDFENFSRGDGGDCLIHPDDNSIYYYQANDRMKRSGKGNIYENENDWFIGMQYEMNPNNYNQVFFGRDKGRLIVYDDENNSISIKSTYNNDSTKYIRKVGAIEYATNDVVYISDFTAQDSGEPYRILKSSNTGNTWIDISINNIQYLNNGSPTTKQLNQALAWKMITDIDSDPEDPNNLWLSIGKVQSNSNGIPVPEKLRVISTSNAGNSWVDFSEGLPAFPVNTLIYHSGTQTLFAGTDVGVFYRQPYNTNMTQWECFSEGMPVGIITDFAINDCSNTLFASLDSRGVYSTPIPFQEIDNTLYESSYTVTNNETWTNDRYFDGDIIIAANTTLNIQCNITFNPENSIIIMPGAELFLAGVLDVNQPCQNKWKGIQVRGNANMAQLPQYQGAIRTFQGAEIRNAEIGVAAYGINHSNNGNIIANSSGGITVIDHAKFRSCKIGVDFIDYLFDNSANSSYSPSITNTDFEISNSYYINQIETPIGIQIINNNIVDIANCNFYGGELEALKSLQNNESILQGIKCWHSPLSVKNSTFNNLSYGIHAMDYSTTNHIVDIDLNDFVNCIYACYLNSMSNARVNRNIFSFEHNYFEVDNIYQIYLDQCNMFTVEENNFDLWWADNENGNSIGIIVNNCGPYNHSIYKNYFNTGHYGILAQNHNRDLTGLNGLSMKCNTFNFGLKNNISVTAEGTTAYNGIAKSQGSMGSGASAPAGNIFSHASSSNSHFWNISRLNATVTYYHHDPITSDASYLVIPGHNNHDHLINGVNREPNYDAPWNEEYTCPSRFTSSGGGDDHKSRMASAGATIVNTENSLQALTDGGDTEALNTEVNTANSNESYTLRNELLNSSPYISDTVLKNATNKEEVLSNPLIRDVLVANPQAAKDQAILDAIDSRNTTMPNYMKEQILNGQTIAGQKEQMEAKLQVNKAEYVNALNYIIYEYYQDTLIKPLDSIIPLLASAKNIEAHYQLAGIYMQQGNITAMNNILNSIPSVFNLDDYHQTELQDLTAYYVLLQNAKAENRSINELTESEKSDLWAWYNGSSNMVSAFARNLLVYLGELEYIAPIILPDMNKSSLITEPFEVNIPKDEYGILNIYPNPAKDFIICEYDIKVKYQDAQIIINEAATGKLVEKSLIYNNKDSKFIDLASFKSGAYIISLKVNENILSSSKISIIK